MALRDALDAVRRRIAEACAAAGRPTDAVELLAVSKRQPLSKLRDALAAGQLDLGESRVQELVEKAGLLVGTPVRWHMIGSIQTNKVRDLLRVPGLVLVHSLDRLKLADALEAELAATATPDRTLDVLLQLNATGEAQKHGFAPEEGLEALRYVSARCPHLRVRGLMAMGKADADPTDVFSEVARLRDTWAEALGMQLPVLSLGMTDDMEQAITAGSTMVRVGTGVFGAR